MYYQDRLCVPDVQELKEEIMAEVHHSRCFIHPWRTKIASKFEWALPVMKKEIAGFVSRYLVPQQVNAEHKKPPGLLQQLEISKWKWKHITMDFIAGFPPTKKGNNGI